MLSIWMFLLSLSVHLILLVYALKTENPTLLKIAVSFHRWRFSTCIGFCFIAPGTCHFILANRWMLWCIYTAQCTFSGVTSNLAWRLPVIDCDIILLTCTCIQHGSLVLRAVTSLIMDLLWIWVLSIYRVLITITKDIYRCTLVWCDRMRKKQVLLMYTLLTCLG